MEYKTGTKYDETGFTVKPIIALSSCFCTNSSRISEITCRAPEISGGFRPKCFQLSEGSS